MTSLSPPPSPRWCQVMWVIQRHANHLHENTDVRGTSITSEHLPDGSIYYQLEVLYKDIARTKDESLHITFSHLEIQTRVSAEVDLHWGGIKWGEDGMSGTIGWKDDPRDD